MAGAFIDSGRDDERADVAARVAWELLGTAYSADAAYVAGYVDISSGDPRRELRGKHLMSLALVLNRIAGRHAEAADAARQLAFAAGAVEGIPFALGAVDDARASGEPRALGGALTALGEAYATIGMAEDARDAFVRAESAGVPPERIVYTYLKHGMLLIGLEAEADLRAGIDYLLEAERLAQSLGNEAYLVAAQLNQAAAYVDLGDVDRALAKLPASDEPRVQLVRGYAHARRGDLSQAERLLALADLSDQDADYYVTFAIEAARGAAGAGDVANAASYYRKAIAKVEELRRAAPHPELRPWILSRRMVPYRELVELLGRGGTVAEAREALAITEALHARTLLDTVIGRDPAGSDDALLAARLRASAPAQDPLSADALLALLHGREALVFASGWRLHILDGRVAMVQLGADALRTVRAFQQDPDDPAVAARAAAALLPTGIGARDQPLYLVPGADFADVPFAALPVDGAPLIAQRAVARLPGLAALGCRTRPRLWTSARVFVGDARGDLPSAAGEVQALGGPAAKTGLAADRASVLAARDATLLHVAVHGHVSRAGGVLELADGPLAAAEIVAQTVSPRVAVLTGCDTGAATDSEGWGSFPTAFLAAGSAFVVATLRAVPDDGAAAVVDAFYQEPETLGPVERLAAAQRRLAIAGALTRAVGIPAPVPTAVWASFGVWGDAACWP